MTTSHPLIILFFFGLISCSSPESKTEKLILNETNIPNQKHEMPSSIGNISPDIISKRDTSETVFSSPKQLKKMKIKMEKILEIETVETHANEADDIIQGFTKNRFIQNGKDYEFNSTIKNDEDRRVGCSGGGNDLSFTVTNAQDTFLIENQRLKSLHFKYHVKGGLYNAYGENPYKGKIKGLLLPDNTWQIDINVWIKMKDMQNNEMERQIVINQIFTRLTN